jgi:hypothetical protein
MSKWLKSHQSKMKKRIVVKQPPPNFFAPQKATNPRSSLLMDASL